MTTLERLKAEFMSRFTIMGGGDILDEIGSPQELWDWIESNFVPKARCSSKSYETQCVYLEGHSGKHYDGSLLYWPTD